MSWNYRIIKRIERHHNSGVPVYTINTVFYDESGSVKQWSDEPAWPVGETTDELRADLERMRRAFELPVLAQSEREDGACMLHHEDGPIVAFTGTPTICPVPERPRPLNEASKPS